LGRKEQICKHEKEENEGVMNMATMGWSEGDEVQVRAEGNKLSITITHKNTKESRIIMLPTQARHFRQEFNEAMNQMEAQNKKMRA